MKSKSKTECRSRWAKLLLALVGVANISVAEIGPNPNEVHINKISYNGTGCPLGTVAENMADDAKAFTLLFDSYVAEAGPGIPFSANRKNCQIAVDLQFPQGWSYTIFTVDYRGYAKLEPGTSGAQQSTYYFQGQPKSAVLKTTYTGPKDSDYHIRDTLGLSSLVWSPCGVNRAVNINTQVRANATGGRRALMTLDSIDGELKHVYGIQWRRCN